MRTNNKTTLAVGVAGAVLVTAGVGLMHIPAGCITAGLFALAWSFLAARAGSRRKGR